MHAPATMPRRSCNNEDDYAGANGSGFLRATAPLLPSTVVLLASGAVINQAYDRRPEPVYLAGVFGGCSICTDGCVYCFVCVKSCGLHRDVSGLRYRWKMESDRLLRLRAAGNLSRELRCERSRIKITSPFALPAHDAAALYAYDAGYLELALHESLPLATLGVALLRACDQTGVPSLECFMSATALALVRPSAVSGSVFSVFTSVEHIVSKTT